MEIRNGWGETNVDDMYTCARHCVWLHLKFYLSYILKWHMTHVKQVLPVYDCTTFLIGETQLLPQCYLCSHLFIQQREEGFFKAIQI